MEYEFDLVIKHELLNEEETKKVSKKYNTSIDKFPRISKDDPQIIKLNPKVGQLIQIQRNDPTGKYIYYRVVVDSA